MPQWIQPEYNAIKDDNLHLLDISPLLKWNIYTYVSDYIPYSIPSAYHYDILISIKIECNHQVL